MKIHLVFHDILENEKDIKRKIDISFSYLRSLVEALNRNLAEDTLPFSSYCLHFDEGYSSFKERVFPYLQKMQVNEVLLAIRANGIGKPGYLTEDDLRFFDLNAKQMPKTTIAAHSVSHPALAQKDVPTPKGGIYQDRSFGEDLLLSEQEVYFQMNESKRKLEQILNHEVKEFVLPFGAYNQTTLAINEEHKLFTTLYAATNQLDSNEELVHPTFDIFNRRTVQETIEILQSLKPQKSSQ